MTCVSSNVFHSFVGRLSLREDDQRATFFCMP